MDRREDIFGHYVDSLPRHKAPETVWDRLQTSLFAVETSRMPTHYPPVLLWHRIEQSRQKAFMRKKAMRWSLAALALLLLGSLAILSWPGSSSKLMENDGSAKTDQSSSVPLPESIDEERGDAYIYRINKMPVKSTSSMVRMGEPTASENQIIASRKLNEPVFIQTKTENFGQLDSKTSSLFDQRFENLKFRQGADDCSPFYSSKSILFGLSHEYQIFNKNGSNSNANLNYWQRPGFNVRLDFEKFYLETGLGISFSRDEIQWEYDYLRKELVDSYVYVDSVYYDPETGETFYYTSIVEVYDSISHTSIRTEKKTQNYLSFPLMAGIRLLDNRSFGMSFQTGVVYNLLIRERKLVIDPYEPESRITNIYIERSRRMEHTFDWTARLNFEWDINHRFMIYFYPSMNYYFTPIYKDDGASGALSFGLGAGIFIK